MSWVKDERTFRDFLSLVIVHAPDEFPQEDYLPREEQLTLSSAFTELRSGLTYLPLPSAGPRSRVELEALLNLAYVEYSKGRDVTGAHLLQDLEQRVLASAAGDA